MPILGITASSISGSLSSAPTNSYFPIASFTVPSGGLTTVTFAGIPQTFQHLQIRWMAKGTTTTSQYTNTTMYYNGDTTGTYRSHYMYGNGASPLATTSTLPVMCMVVDDASGFVPYYSSAIIDIYDYKNPNKYKTARSAYGAATGGTNQAVVGVNSMMYVSLDPITSIALNVIGGTTPMWKQFSTFSLYGVN